MSDFTDLVEALKKAALGIRADRDRVLRWGDQR